MLESSSPSMSYCAPVGRGKGHFVQVFWKKEVQQNVYAMWDG